MYTCLSSFSPHYFQSFESIFESNYDIEEFDIWNEIKSAEDLQKLKRLFEQKGTNVQFMTWINWSPFELTGCEVVELLNLLPNLKAIKFSSWHTKFTGEVSAGSLVPNITCVEVNECNNFMLDFLATVMPENKIKCLKINQVGNAEEKFNMLVKKQSSITSIDICGCDYKSLGCLKDFKLEHLRCILYECEGETDSQTEFIKELIESQKGLKGLDLLNDSDYSFSFVNDSVFAEICGLSNLENLVIGIDKITADGIKSITKLTNLKELEVKTNRDCSLPVFKEFFALKNSVLEKLVLKLWSFDIPAETYRALGNNYEKLKSLKITLGTRHTIGFFAKALPTVEDLSVKFGEANNPVEFSQAFDATEGVKNLNLKKLHLSFWGAEVVDSEKFFKCLECFGSLESLEVDTKFPFTADFVNQLASKLNHIKSLKITQFAVGNNETFPAEIADAFKELAKKLKYAKLTFTNVQDCFAHEGDEMQIRNVSFTFEPFINALKDVYCANEYGFSNIRVHNNLVLTYGTEE